MIYGDTINETLQIGGETNHVKFAEGGVVTFEGTASITLPAETVTVANIDATGTASGSTYLRGDQTWAAVETNKTSFGLYENAAVIAADYSITANNNAISAGPITVNSGVTVTVPSGSTWTVV